MTLGAPLLSITRNADEWLEYSNDNVTLLLSLTKNVFNGDTECYATEIEHSAPYSFTHSLHEPFVQMRL